MSGLDVTLKSVLRDRFTTNAARVRELAAALSEVQFWQKPFTFGNSFGHLVLHLTGNLNYYIGAQIGNTGYIRDRPREFSDATPPSREEALQHFDTAIAMVLQTVREQSSDDWSRKYSGIGTNAPNRLAMVMQCDSHLQHHIGQMIYIANEWQRQSDASSTPK
jgi:DinB superfamily